MKYSFNKKINCTDSTECHITLREKIEQKFNCKLRADNKNDIRNGGISILHDFNDHKIIVNFYEKDETRNNLPTLKKLSKIPTESEIKKII
jgi:hypothetical protein